MLEYLTRALAPHPQLHPAGSTTGGDGAALGAVWHWYVPAPLCVRVRALRKNFVLSDDADIDAVPASSTGPDGTKASESGRSGVGWLVKYLPLFSSG